MTSVSASSIPLPSGETPLLPPHGPNGTPLVVTRPVPKGEPHNFLHRDVAEGEVLYLFTGATYGCIDHNGGVAVSERPRENPFAEFPSDALAVKP